MSLTQKQRKQARQEKILAKLAILKFATREQIQALFGLGSDRNALKVLKEMQEYLTIKNHSGRNVYYLSSKGREVVGVENEIKWTMQVDHYLMRNDLYIFFKQPSDWVIEKAVYFMYGKELKLQEYKLVPDAMFKKDGIYHFVEVDRTQSMIDNKKKIDTYAKMVPSFKQQHGQTPILIFYTLTELRRDKLKELCKEKSIPCKVYTKEDTR